MIEDKDIKIAESFTSRDKKIAEQTDNFSLDHKSVELGQKLGTDIAIQYIKALTTQGPGVGEGTEEMLLQRQILLSFAAISGFERFCGNPEYIAAAKNAFFSYLKINNPEFFPGATDNGALSFYYLAFRRGGEVERRVGQTFAMLCSHDGDPVYQELGEALYCWFTSTVKNAENKLSNNK